MQLTVANVTGMPIKMCAFPFYTKTNAYLYGQESEKMETDNATNSDWSSV